mmetsp:Transcript_115282/g.325777  ORF Transcript_115282/g.325777 Transcript_115282/m.325777 type:complete len:232 (+) Transcript_115282:780-1475(+)
MPFHLVNRLETSLAQLLAQVQNLPPLDHKLTTEHQLDEPGLGAEHLAFTLQTRQEEGFALFVHGEPRLAELKHNVLGALISSYLSLAVEEHHVVERQRGTELESLLKGVLLRDLDALSGKKQLEVHVLFGVVLCVVLKKPRRILLLLTLGHVVLQELPVILRPLFHWQLRDLRAAIAEVVGDACDVAFAVLFALSDGALETCVPRQHFLELLLFDEAPTVFDDFAGVEVRD